MPGDLIHLAEYISMAPRFQILVRMMNCRSAAGSHQGCVAISFLGVRPHVPSISVVPWKELFSDIRMEDSQCLVQGMTRLLGLPFSASNQTWNWFVLHAVFARYVSPFFNSSSKIHYLDAEIVNVSLIRRRLAASPPSLIMQMNRSIGCNFCPVLMFVI